MKNNRNHILHHPLNILLKDPMRFFPVISQEKSNTKPPSSGITLLLMTHALIAL